MTSNSISVERSNRRVTGNKIGMSVFSLEWMLRRAIDIALQLLRRSFKFCFISLFDCLERCFVIDSSLRRQQRSATCPTAEPCQAFDRQGARFTKDHGERKNRQALSCQSFH